MSCAGAFPAWPRWQGGSGVTEMRVRKCHSPHAIVYALKAPLVALLIYGFAAALAHGNAETGANRTCTATTASEFRDCVRRADAGQLDRIDVASRIACSREQRCDFVFDRLTRPLEITGTVAGAGFYRPAAAGPAYGLTVLQTSVPVLIRGLVFDQGPNIDIGAPGAVWHDPACPKETDCPDASISIRQSSHVLIEQSQFIDAKHMGISIFGSSDITIRASLFLHSGVHGIWLGVQPSRGVHIENNVFKDNRSNAVMFAGEAPGPSDPLGMNTITGNTFIHNHNAALYHGCGRNGHDPCGGGQLDIEQHSDAVLIADNRFEDGRLDEDPSLVSDYLVAGIEIAPRFVTNVVIRHNLFRHLTSVPIAIDALQEAGAVKAVDNVLTEPRTLPLQFGNQMAADHGNCLSGTSGCRFSLPHGTIHVGSVACGPQPVRQCTATARWRSSTAEGLRIIVSGSNSKQSLPATAGSKRVAFTAAERLMRVDLYADDLLLSSVWPLGRSE